MCDKERVSNSDFPGMQTLRRWLIYWQSLNKFQEDSLSWWRIVFFIILINNTSCEKSDAMKRRIVHPDWRVEASKAIMTSLRVQCNFYASARYVNKPRHNTQNKVARQLTLFLLTEAEKIGTDSLISLCSLAFSALRESMPNQNISWRMGRCRVRVVAGNRLASDHRKSGSLRINSGAVARKDVLIVPSPVWKLLYTKEMIPGDWSFTIYQKYLAVFQKYIA